MVDCKKEYLALREARKLGITTIGIIDTDCDPDTVDVVIPANDDSIRAISLLLNELADAVAQGKTMDTIRKDVATKPRHIRSKRTVMARADKPEAEQVPEATGETAQSGSEPA